MGNEPIGKRIEMLTMHVRQLRDGRMIATWHLENFAGLVLQLNAPADAHSPPAQGSPRAFHRGGRGGPDPHP